MSPAIHAQRATAGPGRTVHATGSHVPPAAAPAQRAAAQRPPAPGPPTPVDPNASRRSPKQPQAAVTAATDLDVFRLTDLGTGHGSLDNSPSVASDGVGVLETWNWYAARSLNGGASFDYLDPSTLFPATWGGFCCNQVVQYDPVHDLYIWVLEYLPDGSGNNGLRLAVAHGEAGLAAGQFTYWDLTPQQLMGSAPGQYYNLPKIALTNANLLLTASIYAGPTWQRSAVLRLPLAALADGTFDTCCYFYFIPGEFSPALTQGATTTMYVATHVTNSQLKIYSWADGSNSISSYPVTHTAYPTTLPHSCLRTGAPSSADWCKNVDDRLPNGWVSQGKIGFAWTASQGSASGGFGPFAYPYIHAVRINEATHALIDEPYIASSSYAFTDPSIAPNARGDLGGTFLWGGGAYYENCGGLIRDATTGNAWGLFGLTSSNADPSSAQGADYLSTRGNGGNANTWSAGCYKVTGGGVHTYFLSFGRDGDSPFPGAPTNVSASGNSTQFSYSATVSWAPPADNGGHPVTNYVVTPYKGSTSLGARVFGNVTSVTFTGLDEGARYSFAVAAANAFGTGAASPASPPVVYCYGYPATIIGTEGPDTLTGDGGPNVIAGLGGDDHLDGGGGDDVICGGTGNDMVLGRDGTDVLFGDDGNDNVDGGTGFLDLVVGGQGNDTLKGNDSAVVSYLFANQPGVTVDLAKGTASGGEGTDMLSGFAYVFGSPYNDTLRGNGLGNIFFPGTGDDVVDGRDGFDSVAFSAGGVQAHLGVPGAATGEGGDQLFSIEGLAGFGSGENFVGDAMDNSFFFGTGGSGVVHGGSGDDTIIGDAGNDQFFGDAGNDYIAGGDGTNAIDGGSGNDEVSYDRLDAGVSVDLAHGTATSGGNPQDNLKGIETVSGSEYDDTLIGNGIVNTLIGNDGNDTLVGNAGDDFLNGGSGSDTADGGPGKADFCLDTEQTHHCEVKRRTGAGFNRSTPLRPSLPGASLRPGPLGKVGLGQLAQSTTEPTCKPLSHGKGVTSIGPPTTIYVPKGENDATVTWQAWLTRKGSRKRFMTIRTAKASLLTPISTRSKKKNGYRAYTPNDWHYLKTGKMVDRRIFSRPLPPGVYSWTERVDLPSGTFAQDRIPAYFRPPPKTRGHAVTACKFS